MINTDLLQSIQDNIGLTPLQTQIIVELLKQGGECKATDLHTLVNQHMKTNRTTIYSNLEKLKQENIVIESVTDSNTKVYGLVNIDPHDLISSIKKPRESAYENLEKLLSKALEESQSKSLSLSAYYSIPNRKSLFEHVESLIQTSKKYILIQANSLFLEEIFPLIKSKISTNRLDVFVQITWNPRESDSTGIYKKYVELLDSDHVALPHPFYNEYFSQNKPTKKELEAIENADIFVNYMNNIHFIQLLSDEASLTGVHFGEEEGGGHFTRDPFTTQAFYAIFFLIFESSLGRKVNPTIIKSILKDRIVSNLMTIESYKKKD